MRNYSKTFSFGIKFKMGIIFVLFISFNLGSIASIYHFLSLNKNDSTIINVAGAQRMLTQKMAKQSLLIFNGQPFQGELSESMQHYDLSLKNLIYGNEEVGIHENSNYYITSNLYDVQILWEEFEHHLQIIQARSQSKVDLKTDPQTIKALQFIMDNDEKLLQRMNYIVTLYEVEAKKRADKLIFT